MQKCERAQRRALPGGEGATTSVGRRDFWGCWVTVAATSAWCPFPPLVECLAPGQRGCLSQWGEWV